MNQNRQFTEIVDFIRSLYPGQEAVPLHAPVFLGNEKKYLAHCIDSTFVSYVGEFVTRFEEMTAAYLGAKHAIAVSSGTSALHIALKVAGVEQGDGVLTQSLTFIATANAITYCGAEPVFLDSDPDTLGMSPSDLEKFLSENTYINDAGHCINKLNKKRVSACVPVHVMGHPCRISEIIAICDKYNIPVIEDAAESIGSKFNDRHTATFGRMGILSFNGNKTITTGGGGMIITNDENLARKAKHLTTTAKLNHAWEFIHDEIGYNYRMPNVNAAIGCAQMENLDLFIEKKRQTAELYREFFKKAGIEFFTEVPGYFSNYWLNAIFFENRQQRDDFLKFSHEHKILTRPAWWMLNRLDIYKYCLTTRLVNASAIQDRLVNIPSSIR